MAFRQLIWFKSGWRKIIGNVNTFRDWSDVEDIIAGYVHLAEKAKYGDAYNQDSMGTNSVMSYLLISLEEAGYPVNKTETFKEDNVVEDPGVFQWKP